MNGRAQGDAGTKTIVFATIAAGGGHVATARAMAQAVAAHMPGQWRTDVSDYMVDLGFEALDRRHKRTWRWLLARPWLVRNGQRVLDSAAGLTVAVERRVLDSVARAARDHLTRLDPALVVVNHGWLTVALTRAQRHYGLATPVVTFATEPFDANALWADPALERCVVASSSAMRDLTRLGVPESHIDVVGYPVQQAFLHAEGRQQARAHLGLADRFTCLVSLGAEGVAGRPTTLIESLLERGIQVIAVTGRNHALRERLAGLAHRYEQLVVRAFVDDMHRYLAAADVVIGKAGPASVMEALAVGRPVLVTSCAGLNERRVVEFLQANALGRYVPQPEQAVEAALAYLHDPDGLRAVAAAASAIDFAAMTDSVARYLTHYALHRRPPDARGERGLH